jgi:formiminoglutamase
MAEDDPRLGHLLARHLDPDSPPRVVLVGFPTDVGVTRNGGRAGAASAPRAIREVLYRLTPDGERPEGFTELLARTHDLGDVVTSADLERDQLALAEIIAPHLERGTFVIVLGGGHETAYGHFLGYASRRRRVRILNWDAHTDVRALVDGEGHSGSPFRQALEHASRACVDYTVAGLQQHAVARSHEGYITERGGRCIWRTELDAAHIVAIVEEPGDRMVSFDLDAVDQSCAPGVSAPSTGGLTIDEWLTAARMSGRGPNVHSCDIVELNPAFDRDGQTARLAALTVWHILRGVAERER